MSPFFNSAMGRGGNVLIGQVLRKETTQMCPMYVTIATHLVMVMIVAPGSPAQHYKWVFQVKTTDAQSLPLPVLQKPLLHKPHPMTPEREHKFLAPWLSHIKVWAFCDRLSLQT